MATSSIFSYAQAAKGQGSNSLSNATSQAKDAVPGSAGSQTTSAVEHSIESIDVTKDGNVPAIAADKQNSTSNHETETQSEGVQGTHRDPTKEDDTNPLDRPWRQNDKGTRSSSTTTRSVDEQDTRRQRRSKKTRPSEKTSIEQTSQKDPEAGQEPPKVELSEAPIPSVNVWQLRKEAQLAKVKPSTTTTTTTTTEEAVDSLANGVAATKLSEDGAAQTTKDQAANGAKSQKRPGDAARPERNAPRGSRIAEREARESRNDTPPSVTDSAAWPTPEIAIREEKKKPSDKIERVEKEKDAAEDGAQAKSRHKWVTYEYTPTVSFETQLPQMRNSKARGTSRTVNSRGANSIAVEKPTTSTQQNKSSESSRDRPRETSAGASRTATSPSTSKRTPETTQPREQKKPAPSPAITEKPKEPAPIPSEQGPTVRDRPEARNERGRGGFRGRGGHHPVNSHHQQHAGTGFVATGPMPSRAQVPYSPPNRQTGHGQGFISSQRGGRAGRNNTANNFHRLSLPNGALRPPPLQTHYRGYEYPISMSAMPFQPQPQLPQHQPQHPPFWDNMVVPVLKNQIEYYFSIENLCKDMYLRARMDSQGFVPLAFIAAFKRVRDLSADIGLVRTVCEMSTEIDFVSGDDDIERVRRREGWEKFVLPIDDRDDLARNHGPARLIFRNRAYQMPPQFNGMTTSYNMTSPPVYPSHADMPFQQMPDEMAVSHSFDGHMNGNEVGHGMTSQLSADVPDFSPSGVSPFGTQSNGFVVNGQIGEASHYGLSNGMHSVSPHSFQGPSQS